MADNSIDSTKRYEVVTDKGGRQYRRTVAHLPSYYRTDANQKFLSSTLDQVIQKGKLERLDGYIGRLDSYTRNIADKYLEASTSNRQQYQLEPAITIKDTDTSSINPQDKIKFTATYDDYINQLKYFNAPVDNHDRLTKEKTYSWNPYVDMDKLVNYREYYWVPNGPAGIQVKSGSSAKTEIQVKNLAQGAYNFSTHPGKNNPNITLYRGQTYTFNVDASGHPFNIMTEPVPSGIASDGSTSVLYSTGVVGNGTDKGKVTFTVPTTAPNNLYYQCGYHSAMHGIFNIKTATATTKLDVATEILGAINYTTNSGVVLSNGMKLKFTSADVIDSAKYGDKFFYVEGVGEKITLTDIDNLITPESYATETTILYDSVGFDSRPYAKAFYRPDKHDYITIKRDSVDQNAWSRYNRWFHKSVLEETAKANGSAFSLDEDNRAKRPIIEFDSNLRLFNYGSVAKKSVALVDDVTTDVFSSMVNKTGYYVDGIEVTNGMRILFTADTDKLVRNKIYEVNFVKIQGSTVIALQLAEIDDTYPIDGEQVYVEFGKNNQGKTLHFSTSAGPNNDEETWIEGQKKTKLNQQPLFDLYDGAGVSYSDDVKYPSNNFAGTELFSYKISSSATTDSILGLKVKYNTINNVGDLVFESDVNSGSFKYKLDDDFITQTFAPGFTHEITGLLTYNPRTNWVERATESKQRVKRTHFATATEKKLFPIDVYKNSASLSDIEIDVKVNGVSKKITTDYTLANGTTNKYVKFDKDLALHDIVTLHTWSSQPKVKDVGVYEIPDSLSNNPLNETLNEFTLGQITNHIKSASNRSSEITGMIPGVTNLRDKPQTYLTGGALQNHNGNIGAAMFGLIDKEANFVTALDYCNLEYQKFKENFIHVQLGTAFDGDIAGRVDEVLKVMSESKNKNTPFYYDDMIGHGESVTTREYTVMDSSQTEYTLEKQFGLNDLSYRAVYVYLNDVQLIHGYDYKFSTTDDSVEITKSLAAGDKIKIKDYGNTVGSFIPSTPTKLGMYPKFMPEKVEDNTYRTPQNIIIGHDGSKTIAFGDFRDDLLLELEKRIYNNLKAKYQKDLLGLHDILPNAFGSPLFNKTEVDGVLSVDFYNWVGRNNINFRTNDIFKVEDNFTYNFSKSRDLNNEPESGNWRGIFNHYYDTDRPHTNPWEMLGHSEKPAGWETKYGPAPYTSGNKILWDDLERGFDVSTGKVLTRFIRPGLKNRLPVDSKGYIRNPLEIIGGFVRQDINQPWKYGDHGPAETAWRRSSGFAFSIVKAMAVLQANKFFGAYLDPSRLSKNVVGNYVVTSTGLRQKTKTARYHLETTTNVETGVVTRYQTSGYQPMVVNYLVSQNLDPAIFYYDKMKNIEVQLAYKLGGFTDKDNLKILTDSISPGSSSGSQFLPSENYQIFFRTSNPIQKFYYSGVLIEKNSDVGEDGSSIAPGFRVIGYDINNPVFKMLPPIKNSNSFALKTGNAVGVVYKDHLDTAVNVPYGTMFETIQDVVEFLKGYGLWLESQGFVFDFFSREISKTLNWHTAIEEFLYWTTQGWSPGSAITVSPGASGFNLETKNSVIGKLKNVQNKYTVIDSGGRSISERDISVKREANTFNIITKNDNIGLYGIELHTVEKEHILLFDNKTVFSDIIFDPQTGFRQQRLKLVGWKTADWNGGFHAPGFIYDKAEVNLWTANTDYRIGATVEYNAKFYVAKNNHSSGNKFVADNWVYKADKPVAQLMPNFDYKIAQFNDFYDLETDNFDASQQSLAQHLIGYQSRDYLENLFINDISQYKFYQGFIREKGTENAINKLARAKFLDEDIDISVYPEWMIRTGEFGNVDGKKSIQFKMNDDTFLANPQSIELLNTSNDAISYKRSASVTQSDMYSKPLEYTAATTFSQFDYTKEGFDSDFVQKFKTAGYPRIDDTEHTAFNIDDIQNLDVSQLENQDKIWIANNKKGDWDVLRILRTPIRISALQSINEQKQLEVTFDTFHDFKVDDFILISASPYEDLNKVFKIKSINGSNKIVIDFTRNISALSSIADKSTASSYGDISIFRSVRFPTIDDVNDDFSVEDFIVKDETNKRPGDKVFVDNVAGKWSVYEKTPWTLYNRILSPNRIDNQNFGAQVVARNDGRSLIASAPLHGQGTINFYFRREPTPGQSFSVLESKTMTLNDDNTARLGQSLSISSDENFVVAGAPYQNKSSDGSTHQSDQGLVIYYKWNNTTFQYDTGGTIYPPHGDSTTRVGLNFGWDHAIAEPYDSTLATTEKYMFISAPGYDSDAGQVYQYNWTVGADGSTYDTWTQVATIRPADIGSNHRFGHRVITNDTADILVVSSKSPGNAGRVHIFKRTSLTNDNSTQYTWSEQQVLTGLASDGSSENMNFGDSIAMSKDGTTLLIGAPGTEVQDGSTTVFKNDSGSVYYYKWNADGSTNTYTLQQTILPPKSNMSNSNFGSAVSLNSTGKRALISAIGSANPRTMKFDSGATTFDLQDTNVVDINRESGAVYSASLYDTKFILDDRFVNDNVSSNDQFGSSVFATDNSLFIGSPQDDAALQADGSTAYTDDGSIAHYDIKTEVQYPWNALRQEDDLIDNNKIVSSFVFDRSSNKILDWLNYYDPIKGRIFGIADREIKYKTTWDPATYNFDSFGVPQPETAWAEEHIGETWWDLSKAKWIWYEQGDQEYKTKNWGKLFPGSTIDIYEWVESKLLPSEWNALADTSGGLADKISGVPLRADNTLFTIKQKYDSRKDEFVNYYYFWVKNSVFVPPLEKTVMLRANSCAYVSNIITNPQASGLRYFAVSDKNKLITWNVKNMLMNDNIVLNVDYRENDNEADAHKVWKLYAEGDSAIRPSIALESKWWDSLCGTDSLGNSVPDPALPLNRRYGTEIRPRQSWYINRFNALKELIQYTNIKLKENQLVGSVKFTNLNSEDLSPTKDSLEWDGKVATYAELTYLNTKDLSGTVNYLVEADETANGFWSIYQWNGTVWTRTKIQTYKTSAYWNYTDWYDTGVTVDTRIDKQVQYQYELDELTVDNNSYVKVLKSDSGGWKIYKYTNVKGYENVATENGTILLSSKLYDYTVDDTGFAGDDTFDENFFDAEPIIETRNILKALRDDIFTGNLAGEYNTLFFIGLRYVLSEQPYVDWLFKSSFLNITNRLRPLNQRKTYTTGKDDYVESYINEVKPFHTKIREYKLKYTNIETQDGLNTDFDLPPFYEKASNSVRPIMPDSDVDSELLEKFPYKMWKDYHKKHVKSLTLTNAGSGYTKVPTISFVGGTVEDTGPFTLLGRSTSGSTNGQYGYYYPVYTLQSNANVWDKQNGGAGKSHSHTFEEYPNRTFYMPNSSMNHAVNTDPGTYRIFSPGVKTHATAEAVISQGKITKVNLLTKGSGYTTTPEVIISGGKDDGSTPSDTAKISAILGNDLVRDFDTTIRFDRIKSSASVQDWVKNTTYEYGTLVRYDNELYRTTQRITVGEKFNDTGLQKLRGNESFITAAERIKGFYTPDAEMPGLELDQLMDGVDYGGVMVTGLAFNEAGQGWDNSPWFQDSWDGFGKGRIRTFYGDGSTTSFIFAEPPKDTDVFTVYFDGVRQVNEVHRGDTSTTGFVLSTAPGNGVKVEFIPFDDDGVQTPTDDRTLDSLVSGGLFGSALGIDPEHVITDGDEFVSPETSYAPEESVPGQLFDTLDLKVYQAPDSGVPFIVEKNYVCNGSATTFDIGQKPGTTAAVSVIVNNVQKRLSTDYTVNVDAETITFGSAPTLGQRLTIKSFAVSGSQYMVLDSFTGDGSTKVFKTGTRANFSNDSSLSQLYVTVNGIPTTAYTTTVTAKTITLTFTSAPTNGSAVQIAGFNQTAGQGRAYAEIREDTITYDGSTTRYTLTYPVGTYGPYAGLTILELGGKILRGPDNTYYKGDGSTYSYGVVGGQSDDSTVDPAKTITLASQVEVFVNGIVKYLNTDYTIDLGQQKINFVTPPANTDVIAITTNVDTHYVYSGNDIILRTSQIASDSITLNANDTIKATTFNNALGMKQRREVLEGRPLGIHKLKHTPLNSSYVFVWFNSIPLQFGTDYNVDGNTLTISGRTITSSDRIDVMYFAVDSATRATGYRIFKDMLNRTFYKRISSTSTTTLAQDLGVSDRTITLADASVVGDADGTTQLPGVIFIDKERIEFFQKSGNVLSQIRRGTLGTGIKAHIGGTEVVDASGRNTVPYNDTINSNTFVGDGSTVSFITTFTPSSASQLDIFIGGQRLLLTSEDGSTVNYVVDGSTANVTFTSPPAADVQIKILQKKGQVWYTQGSGTAADGKGLSQSSTVAAKFIAEEPTNAPE